MGALLMVGRSLPNKAHQIYFLRSAEIAFRLSHTQYYQTISFICQMGHFTDLTHEKEWLIFNDFLNMKPFFTLMDKETTVKNEHRS